MTTEVLPGDVLAVRSGGLAAIAIRLGAALRGAPNLDNHIAIMHHTDASGVPWCLEGKPGGAGWRDARAYLDSRWTLTNAAQPKTQAQRTGVCKLAESMLGTAYDWEAIADDTAQAFGLPGIWKPGTKGVVPGHVVCSSLAAYAYDRNGLKAPAPGDYRHVTPGNWDEFILTRAWEL